MATFDIVILYILAFEGGYVNNPNDRGGRTKYGITETVARDYGYEGDMKELSLKTAKEIYKEKYWEKLNAEEFDDDLAYALMDTAVNMGVRRAIMLLQESCNDIDPKQEKIAVDGVIGPETKDKIEELNISRLLLGFISNRIQKYFDIVKNNESQKKFINGWLNRMLHLNDRIWAREPQESVSSKERCYTLDEVTNALKGVLETKLGG